MTSPADTAALHVSGDTLRVEGALVRAAVVRLWPQVPAALPGVVRLDLTATNRIDSAGLALLALVAGRCADGGAGLHVDGEPPGYAALRAAYRLGPNLGFAA